MIVLYETLISTMNSVIDTAHFDAVNQEPGYATGLPNHAYVSETFFELEQQRLFAKTWTCIGNACTIPIPGDLKPVGFLGSPLLMLRNSENEVSVFHNVCSHRGNELVWQACRGKKLIQCPYHSWTYDLQGKLRATPHVGGTGVNDIASLDKSKHGLKSARCAVWMDLVFVNLSEDAPAFEEFIEPLQLRIDNLASSDKFDQLQAASSHGQLTIEFDGNWKLCAENNLESYHLPWVHPDLNSVSKLEDHYHFYGGDLFAGQGSNEYDHTKVNNKQFPLFDDWPEKVAEYPTLFPNVFLGLQQDHYWTRYLEPISAGKTKDHLQLYYLGDAATNDEFEDARKLRMDIWAKVFYEDIGVVEGMQRGRKSPAFQGGVFTEIMDEPSHHFAKWVARVMREE